ncbi:MAG: division/cell wall cluster transcriptional repressor MraZ [Bacteroidetes bacterium]|nr:MAG: division/cell wall cluster transcriptional repressor MraZ [Bacteroidota bacterium]REK03483.1 MAG: division/cell wall cluster transcriptional repressor MraZ [Bacteroidota bacterium]REK34788.1 MAG: division/cell wall cluster transcriptional repressor MraZ [Bacteroidota bacterium]REK51333.1 MAG: division/cell wall cluster transcriptional repressor MraZ [Bacteroidota bacterium]
MAGFIGEFPCTVDTKGRFLLPQALKKQVPAKEQKRFVVHRGIEKHLVIYTNKEWGRISEEVNSLNIYVRKNREFIRKFNRGATEIDLDGTGRLLLPKVLMDYAGIDKDIVLFAYGNRIEVWAEKEYERLMKEDNSDFASLAEEVMGKPGKNRDEDLS